MTFTLQDRTKESYFDSISLKDPKTIIAKKRCIRQFADFIQLRFKTSDEQMIEELLKQKPSEMNQNTCDVLQLWINTQSKTKGHSYIINQLSRIKLYLNYRGIKLTNADMSNLNKPRKIQRENYPLQKEQIRLIVDNASYRRKILYLTLAGSLMRIGETCQLRKKDFDTTKKRIVIHIPANITKLKKARSVMVSKEAEPYVLKRLREIEDNDLVFGINENYEYSIMYETNYFMRLIDKLFPDLPRYESGVRKITLHSFRAFGITKVVRTLNDSFAFLLAGQKGYLDQYKRYTEDEIIEDYIKVEPEFFIYQNGPKTQDDKDRRIDELESRLDSIQIMLKELREKR